MDDFWQLYGTALILALAIAAVFFAALAAPVVGFAALPVVGYLYYRNSPATKEREARTRTEALYRAALACAPVDREGNLTRIFATYDEPEAEVAFDLYEAEGFDLPPPVPPICNSVEGARYRDALVAYMSKVHDPERADRFMDALVTCIPRYASSGGLFRATAKLTNEEIERLILPFYDHEEFFRPLRKVIDRNYTEQKEVMPSDYTGKNCAWDYLKNTPLLTLAERKVDIGLVNRNEHTYILAGSGHGKTSLIRYLVTNDMEEDCCAIVIDNQRQMIPALSQMDIPLEDIALISPHNPLALNVLDVRNPELLEFVIAKLMDAPLTSKQQVIFQFGAQLLATLPNATIDTFLRLVDGAKYDLAGVDPLVREFFATKFYTREYDSTRDEISRRLWTLLKDPLFRTMFGATENRVDMHEEMKRKLVLIDADVDLLGQNSGLFGRFFIAQILHEAQRRFRGQHRPVYLYLDEAYFYLDENIERMLETARKANIGLVIAHQYMAQIESDRTRASILANTSTKIVGGVSDADARTLAGYLRVDSVELRDQPKLSFSLWMKGQGTYTIRTPVDFPKDRVRRDLSEEMIRRYAPIPGQEPPQPLPEMPRKPKYPAAKEQPPGVTSEPAEKPSREPKQAPATEVGEVEQNEEPLITLEEEEIRPSDTL